MRLLIAGIILYAAKIICYPSFIQDFLTLQIYSHNSVL